MPIKTLLATGTNTARAMGRAASAASLLCFAAPATAAEFQPVGAFETVFGTHQALRMTGPVAEGDLERLQQALEQSDGSVPNAVGLLITMDSPGGSFQAALRLADYIQTRQIATHVGAGASCLSGCALAFMAGAIPSELTKAGPRRILDRRGVLGFHAPFAGVEVDGIAPDVAMLLLRDMDRNANVNAAAIVNLVAKDILPASLAEELMLHDKSTFRYIDRLYDLGRWDIHLAGEEAVGTGQSLRPKELDGAFCINERHWARDVPFAEYTPEIDAFSAINLEEFCNTSIDGEALVYVYFNETIRHEGPILYWKTLDPATLLADMSDDDVTGAAIYRSPFDRRNEPPSQVDGACLAGYQWIGGWAGAFWSESQAHATYRACPALPNTPRIAITCSHGDTSYELSITSSALAQITLDQAQPISIDGAWVVSPRGKIVTRYGAIQYVGEIGRRHPVFERMREGQVLSMKLGTTEMSLHLRDATLALDALEASCL